MRIDGARALVCGGASGLGAATARRLHAAGAAVTIADLNAERGSALASELGERAGFVHCDVTSPAAVDEAVIAARGDGALRIAVTCAGVGWAEKTAGKRGPHGVEPFHTVIAVNLLGTFHLLRAAGAAMLNNEPDDGGEAGVIVLTASIAAYDGQIGQLAYAASKGGVVGMTLPAARDLAGHRIRVCTIAPGRFDTPRLAGLPDEARAALGEQVPHPARLGAPEEYAALAAHVVENPMLNGEVIRLDGALRMPPR
jgi:3-hydroxyacyl-CoA dehydrogenase/3-hydroxy-2-methylbutyryl-CoA dehydrogenase